MQKSDAQPSEISVAPLPGVLPASPTLEDAIVLAAAAHRGQLYPSPEREPYICHPLRVMLALRAGRERIAAVLHDVVEDTATTLDDLRQAGYSPEVIKAVDCLTRRHGETYSAYIERVVSDEVARRVKLADLADNLANNQRITATVATRARIDRYLRARARISAALDESETLGGEGRAPTGESHSR